MSLRSRTRTLFNTAAATAVVLAFATLDNAAQAIAFDWVTIGDVGNVADQQFRATYGSVGHEYQISKYEATNTQYVEFLNAVATSDPYALYSTSMTLSSVGGITRSGAPGSYAYTVKADAIGKGPGGSDYRYGNRPVVYVSWYDAVRFCNWLTSGVTENGTYTLTGGGPNSGTPTIPDHSTLAANSFFLPTEDEWYKAAYFDGSAYFDFPNGSDDVPNNNPPSADTGNSANYYYSGYTLH